MMEQYNFNQNFKEFLSEIDVTQEDRKLLTDSRLLIRDDIRQSFNRFNIENLYGNNGGVSPILRYTQNQGEKIAIRFMVQGSWVYKTINQPCQYPQQIDVDDGIYVPLSYFENDHRDKSFAELANTIREFIFIILKNKGWSVSMHSKCIRVNINPRAHVDLPIYSAPDDQMRTILKAQKRKAIGTISLNSIRGDENKLTKILLATDNGWIESDPRNIREWVNMCEASHGSGFKKHVRLIKAWRDYKFSKCKLSSIMIMAAVEQAMARDSDRHDESNIAINLSRKINHIYIAIKDNSIFDPDTGEQMVDKLGEQKRDILSYLNELAHNLNEAARKGNVKLLRGCFGDRFPNNSRNKTNNTIPNNHRPTPSITPVRPYRDH